MSSWPTTRASGAVPRIDRRAAGRFVLVRGVTPQAKPGIFLAMADRLGDRPYDIVDVTNLKFPYTRRDGTSTVAQPGRVAIVQTDHLARCSEANVPSHRKNGRTLARLAASADQRTRLSHRYAHGPGFGAGGSLRSPADREYDPGVAEAHSHHRDTMGLNSEPYDQVGERHASGAPSP